MSNDPTAYHKLEPTQAAYSNPYEYYGDVPPIPPPPPPPKQKRPWLMVALIGLVCLVLVLGGLLVAVLAHQNQKSSTGATPTLTTTSTLVVTVPPTATVQPGERSLTPLIEPQGSGYSCYVITTDEAGVIAVLSNPNSTTLFGDCSTFLRQAQGFYYSTTPVNFVPGSTLQCQGWGTDNTAWKIEAPSNDLNTITMCNNLAQVVPPTQG